MTDYIFLNENNVIVNQSGIILDEIKRVINEKISSLKSLLGEPLLTHAYINIIKRLSIVYKGKEDWYFIEFVILLKRGREEYTYTIVHVPFHLHKPLNNIQIELVDNPDTVIDLLKEKTRQDDVDNIISGIKASRGTETARVLAEYTRYPKLLFHTILRVPYKGLIIDRYNFIGGIGIHDVLTDVFFELSDKKNDTLSARVLKLYFRTGRTMKLRALKKMLNYTYRIIIGLTEGDFFIRYKSDYHRIFTLLTFRRELREIVQDTSHLIGGDSNEKYPYPNAYRILDLMKKIYYGYTVSFEDFYRAIFGDFYDMLSLKEKLEAFYDRVHREKKNIQEDKSLLAASF